MKKVIVHRGAALQFPQQTHSAAKGMIVKVYDGKGYAEYSTNEITAEKFARN